MADGPKLGTGTKYREQLAEWINGANVAPGGGNSRILTEAHQVALAWEAGAMPRTPEELILWCKILERGARRAETQRDSIEELLGIVLEKTTTDGGQTFRTMAATLDTSTSRVQRLIRAGRAALALRQKQNSEEAR